jgi:DNA-directed RNA polymerase subunit RPC12/RpoP
MGKKSKAGTAATVTREYKCTACGKTDFSPNAHVIIHNEAGAFASGVQYTSIRWTSGACRSCGQRGILKEIVFDPELWEG